MLVEVYQLNGCANGVENGLFQRFRLAYNCYYQSVVVFIVAVIQQLHSVFATEIVYDFFNFCFIAPFAEIRHTFYNCVHGSVYAEF